MDAAHRVGIVGGGQLARMTGLAAARLGVEIVVLDPDPHCPAGAAGAEVLVGDPADFDLLRQLASRTDVLTLDHENVSVDHLGQLEQLGVRVAPGSVVAEMAIDKLRSRTRFREEGFPVPEVAEVSGLGDVGEFAERFGWPVVLKASSGGYDGRGVDVVASIDAARAALPGLGSKVHAERFVSFDQELSVMVARRRGGEVAVYSPVTSVQRDGMCVEVVCPALVPATVRQAACDLATDLAERFDLVGVMAVELFVVGDDLIVNEIATRPHNSAHHTIEACETSQFEQHLRAILDLPLGSTAMRSPAAAMVNVVGRDDGEPVAAHLADAASVHGASIHLYGKADRPGRKLGHVTAVAATIDDARSIAQRAARRLNGTTGDQEESA
ncbi:MAG: 5-(carboxyamino)imidazole ribonucleotide synthase [Acidimicrobiales bacterium]